MIRFTSYEDSPTAGPTFTRTQAASLLGVSVSSVDKLLTSKFLRGLEQQNIIALANSPHVQLLDGRLPVLRTAPQRDASFSGHDDVSRRYIGASPSMADDELLQASNRWWRSNPDEITAAGYMAVTVSGFVIALLKILSLAKREPDKKGLLRDYYNAILLCRIDDLANEATKRLCEGKMSASDQAACRALLGCRVHAVAGGPIAYAESTGTRPADKPTQPIFVLGGL